MVIDRLFWHGRRVFLTGHTGFKGSWLSLWLNCLGAELTGYALAPPTRPSLFEIADVPLGMKSLEGDIRDFTRLRAAMEQTLPEVVIHMAAQPLVRDSYSDPVGTYATNVMGTVYVLEVARHTPSVRVVLNVTSDKCYENRELLWGYRENEPMGGYDPYSSSKGCAELVTAAYRRSFFANGDGHAVAAASARAGNVIGGGDWAEDRIVPDAMRAFMAGHSLKVRNPKAVRPWQHVLEPLSGYLLLCKKLCENPEDYAEAWNFGPREGDARPVSYLADRMAELWSDGATWEQDDGAHPHEARHLMLDCSKAEARLHWTPRWNLDQALSAAVSWYRSYHHGDMDMRKLILQQIESYEDGLSH